MKTRKNKRITDIILTIIPVITIRLLWGVLAIIIDNKFILPTLKETFSAFIGNFTSKIFYKALFLTLLRALIAFTVSLIIAFTLALLSERENALKIIAPIIAIIRALPTIAIVLLVLLWTNSYIAPMIVTTLVVLPTLYTDIKNSFSVIGKDQIIMCKTFNVGKGDFIKKVALPEIMPEFLNTVGSNLSLNLKLMVAAEVIASTANSVGLLLNQGKVYFETAKMLSIVAVVVIIGLIIEYLFAFVSKKAGKWQ